MKQSRAQELANSIMHFRENFTASQRQVDAWKRDGTWNNALDLIREQKPGMYYSHDLDSVRS